jgi:hypothetical protein
MKVLLSDVVVFWVLTPCSFVVGYKRLRVSCCLHLQNRKEKSVVRARIRCSTLTWFLNSSILQHRVNMQQLLCNFIKEKISQRHCQKIVCLIYIDCANFKRNISDIQPTNWLTPWSRDLLEKLTVTELVKKLPASYGTRRFVTAYTRACHWSLAHVKRIQSTNFHPII